MKHCFTEVRSVFHKRMTGKDVPDVFGGSGFVANATNHLGPRGYVLDTKFGRKYDVTQPLVLTRIRQDRNRFFDRDYDLNKSFHHVLAQPYTLPARALEKHFIFLEPRCERARHSGAASALAIHPLFISFKNGIPTKPVLVASETMGYSVKRDPGTVQQPGPCQLSTTNLDSIIQSLNHSRLMQCLVHLV